MDPVVKPVLPTTGVLIHEREQSQVQGFSANKSLVLEEEDISGSARLARLLPWRSTRRSPSNPRKLWLETLAMLWIVTMVLLVVVLWTIVCEVECHWRLLQVGCLWRSLVAGGSLVCVWAVLVVVQCWLVG